MQGVHDYTEIVLQRHAVTDTQRCQVHTRLCLRHLELEHTCNVALLLAIKISAKHFNHVSLIREISFSLFQNYRKVFH